MEHDKAFIAIISIVAIIAIYSMVSSYTLPEQEITIEQSADITGQAIKTQKLHQQSIPDILMQAKRNPPNDPKKFSAMLS